jgi:hypothetical protein
MSKNQDIQARWDGLASYFSTVAVTPTSVAFESGVLFSGHATGAVLLCGLRTTFGVKTVPDDVDLHVPAGR